MHTPPTRCAGESHCVFKVQKQLNYSQSKAVTSWKYASVHNNDYSAGNTPTNSNLEDTLLPILPHHDLLVQDKGDESDVALKLLSDTWTVKNNFEKSALNINLVGC